MKENVIEVAHLHFAYARKHEHKDALVLKNISFTAGAGERLGLIGANGVGKSTLLKLFVGLLEYQRNMGSVKLCGLDLCKDNLRELRKRIGYVFQDSDSQLFMADIYSDVAFAAQNYGYSEQEVHERVERALAQVHLQDLAKRQIYRLSGGQKKLVAIAGILTLTPELILMDEPSAALDAKNRRNLINILRSLPCTQVIASHDLDFIYETCDRVLLLHEGGIAADGAAQEVLRNKVLLEQCDLELPLMLQQPKI